MAGKHVRAPEKKPHGLLWLWVVVAVVVVAVAVAAVWQMKWPAPAPAGTLPIGTITTNTTPTTTVTTPTTTAPTPPPTPVVRDFARPGQMRGVWLTAGVDYDADGDAATVKAQIDAAFDALEGWQWNTVLAVLPADFQVKGFDAPAYILEKAREKDLYIYMVIDCGVMTENGRDPTVLQDNVELVTGARNMAIRYPADGFLLTGYSYLYGHKPEAVANHISVMLTDAIEAIHGVNKDAYVGLLTEAVWAHASVEEGGSNTANVYEEFTDGGVDTRSLVLNGVADFVMVKDFRATGDYSADFSVVLNWWAEVCKQADTPLYIAHAATRDWKTEDQLARQILACQKVEGWQGSAFNSATALTKKAAATNAMKQAFDGTLMEEYISRTLKLTYPEKAQTVTNESAINLRGSADPNFPLTLNGEEITLTNHGYFSLDIELQPGDNVFTFQNKGVTTTYTVHYDIVILKGVAPAEGLVMDGGSAITVSAVAHKNATLFATVNGQKIPLAITEVQEDENTAEDSDYVTFAAEYTLPAGKEGKEQKLGAVTVTGSYLGQTETLTGGTLTVKALPIKEETKVEDVVIPDLTPIDPAVGGDTLAEGTVLIVKPDYVETFSGDTTDDYSRPTNAYLPKGTTDILAGTAYDASSNRHYYLLGCGRRVYQEDVEVYITGGRLDANHLTVGGTVVSDKGTAVTVAADWRVPFQLQLLPQKYGNPAKQNYNADAQTTEYIEITFYYTTVVEGEVDVSASPLFTKAEWTVGEDNTQILRLYLTKKAQFYGYRVLWDNEGNLTFTFKHPTYVGDNDAEQPLAGFTVVVDPGHGGHSYGTSGGGVPEKAIALTYANLLRDKLESLGATVIMTRTDDSDLSLLERTQITRATHADLFLSIHMNGSTSASVGGCSIHYFSDYSIGIADTMFDEMLSVYKDYGSDNKRDWRWSPFYVCRISEMPALLLECGYMTNAEDLELLVTPDFQDALTAAMAKSVVAYAQSLPKI